MERVKGSIIAKLIAWIAVIVSSITFLMSVLGMMAGAGLGIYEKREEEILQNTYEEVARVYAYRIMDYLQVAGKNSNEEYFQDRKNVKYVVLKLAEDFKEEDLYNKDKYVQTNWASTEITEDCFTYDFYVDGKMAYVYSEDLFQLYNSFYYRLATEEGDSFEDVDEVEATYDNEAEVIYDNEVEDKTVHYCVAVAYPSDSLVMEKNWRDGDLFVKVKILISALYSVRYIMIVSVFLSTIVFLGAMIFLLQAAGHRKGTEEIVRSWFDRIPSDVWLIASGSLIFIGLGAVIFAFDVFARQFSIMLGGMLALLLEIFCIFMLQSISVRIKTKTLLSNTLLAKVGSRIFTTAKQTCGKVSENISLLWKAGILYALFCFIEFCAIAAFYSSGALVFLWFVKSIFVALLLIKLLLDFKKLQEVGKHLAEGETDYKVDTEHMFLDFQKHGEDLNNIGGGIQKAVTERMKSEHFKTELITNVSHDIKTPLTSIINYVDLLEKAEVENADVQEYIEVLTRQSHRLKKLIEDLMEASKASTGNLTVAMEKCDAGVFLEQMLGEYRERTKKEGLELIVKGSEEPIFILADGRHLWRIIDNLLNNICKYSQPQTRVYIDLKAEDSQAVLIFRNTSKYSLNITAEELMERFVRGDSSRNTEGSGLGLNIAQNLTELMKGTFELVVDGDLFKVTIKFPMVKNEM